MRARKRTRDEALKEEDAPTRPEPTLLDRIRNMSEFAALLQYLDIFGAAMKVEKLTIEVMAPKYVAQLQMWFCEDAANTSYQS